MAQNITALALYRKKEQKQQSPIEQAVQQVKDLFKVNTVFVLQVCNYYQMSEKSKRHLCETYLPITLCKVPAREGEGMWFFLSKEAAL
jgi:hypothetical protein